jgi:putative SOS response-associated peptidase YedK
MDEKELRDIVSAAQRSIRLPEKGAATDAAKARIIARDVNAAMTGGPAAATAPWKGGEVCPGDVAPVLTAGGAARFMTWGFPSLYGKQPHINARSETAAGAITFRDAWLNRRCLVPATCYFEWKHPGAKTGKKQREKYAFRLPDSPLLYMAGIYTTGGMFAILTRAASHGISEIHDRMPVIIPKALATFWLEESPQVVAKAVTELRFAPADDPVTDDRPVQLSLFG